MKNTSEYTLDDFVNTIYHEDIVEKLGSLKPVKVIRAWGVNGDYSEWTGGFCMIMNDNTFCYIQGACDTTGWG